MTRLPWSLLSVAALAATPSVQARSAGAVGHRAFENNLRAEIAVKGREGERFGLDARMAHYAVPGVSVAVIDHCRIVDARGFGRAAPGGPAMSPRTLLQAASLTKPVTAFAALRLVQQGKLTLDSDIAASVPTWALPQSPLTQGQPITLRRLLNHTSGLNEENYQGYAVGQSIPDLQAVLQGQPPANNAAARVEAVPGTRWTYSGPGYLVAQTLMTEAVRQPFPSLLRDLVFRPIGMWDSYIAQPLAPALEGRAAHGVGPDGRPLAGGWRVYPELAAAGLWTTPRDYAQFVLALARAARGDDHHLLRRDLARAMMTRGLGDWGLGVDLSAKRARRFSHTGANAGFQSAFVVYPDTCQGAVVMTNADEGGWLIIEVMRAIGDTYGWPDRKAARVQSAVRLTAPIARRFVGTYQLRDFPTERFAISASGSGKLRWARAGHIGRDLLAIDEAHLFSPDSEMLIEANHSIGERADTLSVSFGGGTNVATRLD